MTDLETIGETLNRIEAKLMVSAPLGFSASAPARLFLNHPNAPAEGAKGAYFYFRDETTRVNSPIFEDQLTCLITTLYRRDSLDRAGKDRPLLELHLWADKRYIFQAGFYTNFSSSLLAALANLPAGALHAPVTLRCEHTQGRRGHPTVFAQVIYDGKRVVRTADSKRNKQHLAQLTRQYGFSNPVTTASHGGNEQGEPDA